MKANSARRILRIGTDIGAESELQPFARAIVDLGYIWRERAAHRSPEAAVAPAFPKP